MATVEPSLAGIGSQQIASVEEGRRRREAVQRGKGQSSRERDRQEHGATGSGKGCGQGR